MTQLEHPYARPKSTAVMVYAAACEARILRASHGLPQPKRPSDGDRAVLEKRLGRSATELELCCFADLFESETP
jgi:hypothetical protein